MTLFWSKQTGTWHVRFVSPHGERTVDTGATEEGEAKKRCRLAKIAQLETAAAAGRLTAEALALMGSGEKLTVAEAVERYGEWAAAERAPKTAAANLGILRKFCRECEVGGMAPGQVKSNHVCEFINRPQLKLSTRKVLRAILSGFFGFCVDQGWIVGNPAARAPIRYSEIPIEQKERKAKALFSGVELEYLIGRLEGFWTFAVVTSSEVGLRLSDGCNLEWGCFDFRQGLVTLWMEKTNERLSLPMTPRVQRAALALKQTDPRWVFPEQRETWIRAQSTLSHQFKRLCRKLDLDHHCFHGLRATFATREYHGQVRDGADSVAIGVVAGKLGHRSAVTTARHYVRTTGFQNRRG